MKKDFMTDREREWMSRQKHQNNDATSIILVLTLIAVLFHWLVLPSLLQVAEAHEETHPHDMGNFELCQEWREGGMRIENAPAETVDEFCKSIGA